MADAIVIGAYEFLGFHVSKLLLEDGLEVIGTTLDGSLADEVEQKMMEIGRNANFSYLEQLTMLDSITEDSIIYISIYDYIKKGSKYGDIYTEIQRLVQKWKLLGTKLPRILFFLPIMQGNSRKEDSFGQELAEKLEEVAEKCIYLPTIYGPFQPENMSFEAGIRGKSAQAVAQAFQEEYTDDAVHILDILSELNEILAVPEERIIVKSRKKDQWLTCAKQLFSEKQLSSVSIIGDMQINSGDYCYLISNKTTPEEGIQIQKEYRQFLDSLRDGKNE
ncbi:hypothetical protein D0469_13160 [Peribacillus saganii]|uniref:NAD(P)-dependent oxidoreductase n=1 Tax=Peribacillus saganii TaxID=2303992 RepID=A0A372LNW9_9BACI|nr:hypothetical protein [Peribacillus saganii]RFU68036.1 hypothetical protein D0469_13160 [Peribacillus saganii]